MSITGMCPDLVKQLDEYFVHPIKGKLPKHSAGCAGYLEALKKESTRVVVYEEMVEIPPKDEVDANMIKRGFLKPRMRPKTISIEYKPRTME